MKPATGSEVESVEQAIVYGEDDRVDVFEAEPRFAALAQSTAVALIAADKLSSLENGEYGIDAPSYGELQTLCPGERFADQPAAANCSGVLIAPGVVATAGHCLSVAADGSADCSQSRYVFGFTITEPDVSVVISADNVRECERVLVHLKTPPGSACRYDIALIELKPSLGSTVIPAVARASSVEGGEVLRVIGSTAGLPIKIDSGARVIDTRSGHGDYFTLSSDTFSVSSGSGVFDVDGRLVALFARGRRDYDTGEPDDAGVTCQRVHAEPEEGSNSYEEATHIAAVLRLLHSIRGEQVLEPWADRQCDPIGLLQATMAVDGGMPVVPTTLISTSSASCSFAGHASGSTGGTGALWSVLIGIGLMTRRRK